jgi:hypothetical protein
MANLKLRNSYVRSQILGVVEQWRLEQQRAGCVSQTSLYWQDYVIRYFAALEVGTNFWIIWLITSFSNYDTAKVP